METHRRSSSTDTAPAPAGKLAGGQFPMTIDSLIGRIRAYHPDVNAELIRAAYDLAAEAHREQKRDNGAPYITHPLAVATILAETGADDEMLCAAMLHDTIEDTPYTLAALSGEFGAGVAARVTGTAALDQIKGRGRRTVTHVMAAVKCADTRVLAIKLADRLHNMRTVQFIPQVKQLRKARESRDIFVRVPATGLTIHRKPDIP